MFIEKLPFKTFYLFIRTSVEIGPSIHLQFAECCFSNYKQATIDIRSTYYICVKVA